MSKALKAFTETHDRTLALLNYQAALRKADPTKGALCDDVVRSCVVLAVAAMDTYFTRKFTEVLVPYLKNRKPTDEMVELLGEAGLGTKEALVMLGMERPYRRVRTLISSHLSNYTTQHFDKIDELFKCFAINDLTLHAERKTRRTMLRQSVRRLVMRRNDIAHEGDLNSHGKVESVKADRLTKRIKDLRTLVTAADSIVDSATANKKAKAKPVKKKPAPKKATAKSAVKRASSGKKK